jgi:4'-phosphopantetheinyl transferase
MATGERRRARGSDIAPTRRLTDQVDLWLDRVDAASEVDRLAEQLDPTEVARAERFRFRRDRSRFVARRAFLRRVLAGYTGVAPARIRYRVSARGRPELESPGGITFSASHSDGLAVIAVARDRLVGVDLERIRPIPDVLDLANRVCSPAEYAGLQSVAEPVRGESFLRLWTRKESYVKALGTGLSMPLTDVDVGNGDGQTRRLPGSDESFVFAGLDGLPGYVGALAASGSHLSVRYADAMGLVS